MKLQAGKTYRRRDGGLESIVRVELGIAYNAQVEGWWLNGMSNDGHTSDSDLISEVSDEPFTETAEQGLSVVRSWSSHFDQWWDNEGSGMPPGPNEDQDEADATPLPWHAGVLAKPTLNSTSQSDAQS